MADYKNSIKDLIFSQQDLMKLIYYSDLNPLSKAEIDNPYDLIDSYVMFKPRSFDTTESVQTFLLVNFDAYGNNRDNIYFNVNINFDIIVHKDIITLFDDTDRMDCILEYIDEWINSVNLPNCGFGRVKFEKFAPLSVNKDYIANRLIYSTNNFNQNYNRQV